MVTDQRLTQRLITYWDTMRKDEPIPNFSKFNSAAISDIWQQCILFVVQPGSERGTILNFNMVGDKLNGIYSQSMIGTCFNPSHRHFQGAAVVSKVDKMMADLAPLLDSGQFINNNGKVVKYRSCLLPFGRQGVVTHVVAGLSWREF